MGMFMWKTSFKLLISDMCMLCILYISIKVTKKVLNSYYLPGVK